MKVSKIVLIVGSIIYLSFGLLFFIHPDAITDMDGIVLPKTFGLHPHSDLSPKGNLRNMIIMTGLAVFILTIAVFNLHFVNNVGYRGGA